MFGVRGGGGAAVGGSLMSVSCLLGCRGERLLGTRNDEQYRPSGRVEGRGSEKI